MKTAILGFGHLGKAFAGGVLHSSALKAEDILVCSGTEKSLSVARDKFGLATTLSAKQAVDWADTVFSIVKAPVFEELAPDLDFSGKTLVSFMAGMNMARLNELAPGAVIVRAMPTIAMADCSGTLCYTKAPEHITRILDSLGYSMELDEKGLDYFMAFAGCGPGFAAFILDCYARVGESMGFDKETSRRITALTFKNAIDANDDFAQTVREVATKGGATEQGVDYMRDRDAFGMLQKAVQKAYDRMN